LKIKVSFVELDETTLFTAQTASWRITCCGRTFLRCSNRKERSITVLPRNGFTKAGEISTILGYANHSPVSKALKRIRQKAMKYFERQLIIPNSRSNVSLAAKYVLHLYAKGKERARNDF
jgi:hypothetical protein